MRNFKASSIFIAMSGALSLSYSMLLTIELIYLAKVVGMSPLQLILIGTLQQTVCLLLQAPTGVLADMYSRRWAVVLGVLLIGISYLIEGLVPIFTVVLSIQVTRGIGVTLMAGADTAWIADEVGADHAGPVYIRAAQVGSLCSLVGIGISMGLVSVRLNLPVALGGALIIAVSLILALVMPERNFKPAPREERTSWQQMAYTLRSGIRLVRLRPVLLTVLGIGVFAGIFSAGFDQLWQYYLLHGFSFPVLGGLASETWFCIIEACIVTTNFCGTEIARRFVDMKSHRAVALALFVSDALMMVGVIAFALAGQFLLALAAFFLFTTAGGPRMSLEQIWMNQNLESSVRATVFSLRGQVSAIAQITGGPLLGLLATHYSTRAAILVTGIILAPALLLYARTMRRDTPLARPLEPEVKATLLEE
ncbi:MFS transporter [Ktedonospora formicarum]|uniref:MFS transporter n=1 Tax=Ktedonospora formicarum TaxID=2778364 RepID=A0A8J3ICG2_9CHLR|nr:MFS transporter [Ktedonospora formicarum]GHO49564.1 MFS transporter [Ktedonospora formicarum]